MVGRAAMVTLVTLVSAVALTASCTRVVHDARAVAADRGAVGANPGGCAEVDVPLADVPARGVGEPRMRIPTPPGWQRVTALDSELIRYAMRNPAMAADGFTPTSVLTFESEPGAASPQTVFEAQLSGLRQLGVSDFDVEARTTCGLPAEIIRYTAPAIGAVGPRPAVVLCVVRSAPDHTDAATLTVQSTDATNPVLRHDTDTMFTGFQLLPPGPG